MSQPFTSSIRRSLPVLVAGGGLGGLGLAVALGHHGVPVQVLEQASEIAPIGYGIQLGPNVFRIFDELGIRQQVLAAAHQPPSLVMPDSESGRELLRIELHTAAFQRRFSDPYVVIHRGDLHQILLEACDCSPNITLTPSANVVHYQDRPDGIKVLTEDGRDFEGVALVGADGVKSTLRETLVSEKGPVPVGYVAHRTTVPMDRVPAAFPYRDEVVLWAGPGHHVVNYPLRNSSVCNIVAVFQSDGNDANRDYRREFESVYRGVYGPLRELLDLMDVGRRWDLTDRDPIRHWHRGRVALLGDAAHPALQSLAQGACMALEDASCLARSIAAMPDESAMALNDAFIAYQNARLIRTARVQLESRSLWQFYHAGGVEREVRDSELASRSVEDVFNCVGWLWDGQAN